MRLLIGWLLVLCSAWLHGARPANADDEVSAQDLIRLAPIIDTTKCAYRSVRIEGKLNFGMELRFQALYRAPDQHALFFEDGRDGTPLLLASNGTLIVYDPVRPVALFEEIEHVTLRIGCKDNRLNWNFGFNSKQDHPSKIEVDLASLYSNSERADSVVALADQRYRLISNSPKGASLLAEIDLARPCPFTRVDFFVEADDQACLSIESIAVDEELDDEQFMLPTKDQLAKKIRVRDLSGEGFLNNVTGIALVMRAVYARIGANDPEVREAIKYPGLIGIDWDQVQKHDREFSQAFR